MPSIFRISIIGMILLGIGTFLSGFAQDIKTDIQHINQAYKSHKNYRADLEYSLYPSHTSKVPHQTLKGHIQNQGKSQYSRMEKIETLINDQYALLVNHERHSMSIQKAFDIRPAMPEVNLDSLSNYCKDIRYTEIDEHRVAYDFHFEAHEYSRIRMIFDPNTYLVRQFSFFHPDPTELVPGQKPQPIRMEINFRNIRVNQALPKTAFSTDKFIQKVGNTYQPNTTYASYQLVNFLPKN